MARKFFLAFERLTETDQATPQSRFSADGRQGIWQTIEAWAFRVDGKTGRLLDDRRIEPAISLKGNRFDALFICAGRRVRLVRSDRGAK